jgi:putative aldouronate transport system substrate-binding protein
MIKMGKIPYLVLTALLMFCVLVSGCSEEVKSVESDMNAMKTAGEVKSQLPPYEINWYVVGNGQPKDTPQVEGAVNRIIKEKINATVKFHVIDWGSWGQKVGAMIAASEYMDIIFTADWLGYTGYIAKNAFLPLNELMDKYAPITKEQLGDAFITGSQFDGVNYGIPCNKERAASGGVLFKKELLDKYGFDINTIKKMEDIEPWLKMIKEREANIIPYGTDNGNNWYFSPFVNISGDGSIPCVLYDDNRDTRIVNEWETPEKKAFLDTVHKWYEAGYISKDAATSNARYNDHINAGDFFAFPQPLKPGKDNEMSLKTGGKATYVQVSLSREYIRTNDVGGSMQAISKTSLDPDRCMMFLEILNTDKAVNNLFAWGIPDVHYKKVDETFIEPIPDSGWSQMKGMQWSLQNQFLNYLAKGEAADKWDKLRQFNRGALPHLSLGFRFNKEPFQAEYAAIAIAGSEFSGVLNVGAVDPVTALPKHIEKLKAAGVEKVMAAIQKDFDAWYLKNGKN